jgi:Lon protease-like protein
VLPVSLKAKQKLMELGDGGTRLEIVHTYLKQHAVSVTAQVFAGCRPMPRSSRRISAGRGRLD